MKATSKSRNRNPGLRLRKAVALFLIARGSLAENHGTYNVKRNMYQLQTKVFSVTKMS